MSGPPPVGVLAAAAVLLLAPSTLGAGYLTVRAIAVAAGPGPVGLDRLRPAPAHTAYFHDLTPSWSAVAGLSLAVIAFALSIAVRPRPAPVHPLAEPGR